MKIYLARHGQSRWQVERGNPDWNAPLSDLGHEQGRLLGNWFNNGRLLDSSSRIDIKAIYASPLERAQDTAGYTAKALNLPSTTLEPLAEAQFLISPHLPSAESPRQPPPTSPLSDEYLTFKAQAQTALDMLVAEAESQDGPILAFAHGALMSTLFRIAAGSDTVSFWIYNTSLNLIEWKRGRWHFVYLNMLDHLPPELRTY
ncbi:MAG: histidine phosphatase family protein [Aquificales bacterium]|nr:histidine phosphatase family protein [Aquificales bacterium]